MGLLPCLLAISGRGPSRYGPEEESSCEKMLEIELTVCRKYNRCTLDRYRDELAEGNHSSPPLVFHSGRTFGGDEQRDIVILSSVST